LKVSGVVADLIAGVKTVLLPDEGRVDQVWFYYWVRVY
jgi:hypothetical protein